MRKKKSETRKRTIEREKWTTTELQIDFEKWFYFISFALNLTLSVCEYFIKSDLSIFFPHFYDFVCVRVCARQISIIQQTQRHSPATTTNCN